MNECNPRNDTVSLSTGFWLPHSALVCPLCYPTLLFTQPRAERYLLGASAGQRWLSVIWRQRPRLCLTIPVYPKHRLMETPTLSQKFKTVLPLPRMVLTPLYSHNPAQGSLLAWSLPDLVSLSLLASTFRLWSQAFVDRLRSWSP